MLCIGWTHIFQVKNLAKFHPWKKNTLLYDWTFQKLRRIIFSFKKKKKGSYPALLTQLVSPKKSFKEKSVGRALYTTIASPRAVPTYLPTFTL